MSFVNLGRAQSIPLSWRHQRKSHMFTYRVARGKVAGSCQHIPMQTDAFHTMIHCQNAFNFRSLQFPLVLRRHLHCPTRNSSSRQNGPKIWWWTWKRWSSTSANTFGSGDVKGNLAWIKWDVKGHELDFTRISEKRLPLAGKRQPKDHGHQSCVDVDLSKWAPKSWPMHHLKTVTVCHCHNSSRKVCMLSSFAFQSQCNTYIHIHRSVEWESHLAINENRDP